MSINRESGRRAYSVVADTYIKVLSSRDHTFRNHMAERSGQKLSQAQLTSNPVQLLAVEDHEQLTSLKRVFHL